jgi:uncharacterized membrane protein YvbJ
LTVASCASCGEPLADDDQFCSACGAVVNSLPVADGTRIACPACGSPNKDGTTFCIFCGATIGAGQVRKDPEVASRRKQRRILVLAILLTLLVVGACIACNLLALNLPAPVQFT